MGHAQKQLVCCITTHLSKTCPIYNSPYVDTWLYVLLTCKQQHIHAQILETHNKVV